uniref:FTH domain-containing protein n=1 Tax=Panagrellus redivivus TaxID=6233 RepID=A0A7E4VZZ9_PANRE
MPTTPVLSNLLVRDLCSVLFNKKRNADEEFSDPTPYINFALASRSALFWTVANASQLMHVIFDKEKVYVDCCSPDVKLMFDRGFGLFHGYARTAVFFDIGETEEEVAALMEQFSVFKKLDHLIVGHMITDKVVTQLTPMLRELAVLQCRPGFLPREPVKFTNLTEMTLFEENVPVFDMLAIHEYPVLEKLDVSYFLSTSQELCCIIQGAKIASLKSVSLDIKSCEEFDAPFVGNIQKFMQNFRHVPEFMFKLTCQPPSVDIATANEAHAAFQAIQFGAHVQLDVFQRSFKLLHRPQLEGSGFAEFDHGWMYTATLPGKYICHTIDNLFGHLVAESNNLTHGDDEDACVII